MLQLLTVQNVFAPSDDRPRSLLGAFLCVSISLSVPIGDTEIASNKNSPDKPGCYSTNICTLILAMTKPKKNQERNCSTNSVLAKKLKMLLWHLRQVCRFWLEAKKLKMLLWRFRQVCRFWQPIVAVAAAIVSILVALISK